jgi:phosphatidylglycerophosphate synthase
MAGYEHIQVAGDAPAKDRMNLPNAITVGRIFVTPLIAFLPFVNSWPMRFAAFAIYITAAVTDYYDGMLARTRNLVTDLGKLLDPLADKLLLLGTLIPMYLLGGGTTAWSPFAARDFFSLDPELAATGRQMPLVTPLGPLGLPLWIVLVVLGREALMTAFRQIAARRGVVIAAIGPAKWKTGFQSTWVGATYFWFAYATLLLSGAWQPTGGTARLARGVAYFVGSVALVTMICAVVLTVYSLWLYVRRYGYLLGAARSPAR